MRGSRANPPVLKRLGQHFLADQSILGAIADAVAPEAGDVVVEIGPGRGALTDILASRANPLVAIEIDRALAGNLAERYASNPGVTILEKDVLEVDIAAVAGGPFVVAGNVPYYITTPILFHVLRPPYPRHAVFLVQREVAERMVSPAGSKTYGALSANVQAVANVELICTVAAGRLPSATEGGVGCGESCAAFGSNRHSERSRAIPDLRAGTLRNEAQADWKFSPLCGRIVR